jgi:hypothetical protein
MSEVFKIFLTAATTIIGGVFLFVVNQLFQRLVVDPVQEQRTAIGVIDHRLTYWSWAYSNPQENKSLERDRAMDELREAAARLLAATNAIRSWWVALRLGAVARPSVNEAARELIGLSNGIYGRLDHNHPPRRAAERVRQLLRIPLAGRAEQSAEAV